MNYALESTSSQPTMTTKVGIPNSPTHSTNDNQDELFLTFLPRWSIKKIEDARSNARDVSIGQQNRNKKQWGSDFLVEHVLSTCDIDTYVDS